MFRSKSIFNPFHYIANRRIIVLYIYYILNSEVLKFIPNVIELIYVLYSIARNRIWKPCV